MVVTPCDIMHRIYILLLIFSGEYTLHVLQRAISPITIMATDLARSLSCHFLWLLYTDTGLLFLHRLPNSIASVVHFICFISSPDSPSWLLISYLQVLFLHLPLLVMSRLRRKPKRGLAWYQTYGRTVRRNLNQQQTFPNSSSPPPSPPPSSSSVLHGLAPLSSPWACRVELFDNQGNYMGFVHGTISNMPSTSHPSSSPTTPQVAYQPSATSIPSAVTPSQPHPPFYTPMATTLSSWHQWIFCKD